MDSATIAGRLAQHIEAAGTPLRAVASGTGIPLSTLHRRLRTGSGFTLDEALALATFLGVDFAEIASERVAS